MLNSHREAENVYYASENETIIYAAQELSKYIGMMDESSAQKPVRHDNLLEAGNKEGFWVGLFDELEIKSLGVDDPFLDDEIYISIKNGSGIIAGINHRSVLLAVYRMLSEAGCVWARPGVDGEYVPARRLEDISILVHEKPSYRHRGITPNATKNREDVLDIIRWAPKLGFNAIFFEGIEPWKENFYNHFDLLTKSEDKVETYTESMSEIYFKEAISEVNRLGLLYHGAGHGFTCLPLGIAPSYKGGLSDDVKQHIAIIDGKRKIVGNGNGTNLCYSRSDTREIVTDYIVELVKDRSEMDLIHVWLADGVNNHCECDECSKELPSDLYVRLLNELDEKLTANNLSTRIVFLSYLDLIWKPETEKLLNKDRFILTHAPFYRVYSKSFRDVGELPGIPSFVRNKNKYPESIEENAAVIKSWQDYFGGDSFVFDYHFWGAQFRDPSQMKMARVLYDDIVSLKNHSINGYVSCQITKSFFPIGLGMHVMGRALWNDGIAFEDLVQEYFDGAFGKEGQKALEFIKNISTKLVDSDFKGERGFIKKEDATRFDSLICDIEDFREVIRKNTAITRYGQLASWNILDMYSKLITMLASALEAEAEGNENRMEIMWNILELYMREHEEELLKVFDYYFYMSWIKGKFVPSVL